MSTLEHRLPPSEDWSTWRWSLSNRKDSPYDGNLLSRALLKLTIWFHSSWVTNINRLSVDQMRWFLDEEKIYLLYIKHCKSTHYNIFDILKCLIIARHVNGIFLSKDIAYWETNKLNRIDLWSVGNFVYFPILWIQFRFSPSLSNLLK